MTRKSTVQHYELSVTLKPVVHGDDGMLPSRVADLGIAVVSNSLSKLPSGASVRFTYDVPGQSA